jgi:hypothetical protein
MRTRHAAWRLVDWHLQLLQLVHTPEQTEFPKQAGANITQACFFNVRSEYFCAYFRLNIGVIY